MRSKLIISILCFASLLLAQAEPGDRVEENAAPQNYYVQAEEKPSGLHKIVSVPCKIVFSPLRLLGYGLEKGLLAVEKRNLVSRISYLFSQITSRAFSVSLGGLGPGSGLGGGIGVSESDLFGSPLSVSASAALSTNLYQDYEASLEKPPANDFSFETRGRYGLKHQQVFYGLGPETIAGDTAFWGSEETLVHLQLGTFLGKNVRIAGCADYQNTGVYTAKDASVSVHDLHPELVGLCGAELISTAVSIMHDSRDKPGDSFSGGTERVSFGFSRDVTGEAFRFFDYTLETTRYFTVIRRGRKISVRLLYQGTEPLESGEVPFFSMPRLGGGNSLRGYPEDRFWDRQAVCASVEYSYPIWRTGADAVVFTDMGQVFNEFPDIGLQTLAVTYGGGIRVKSPNTVIGRLEIGKSPEGFRIMLSLSPAFE